MTLDLALFLLLALIAIASALGMLLSRNAVYSALYLVLNFVTVAVFYLLLSAPFIAMAQVTVYAGAIMVLFLFVIMLLGSTDLAGEFGWQKVWFPVSLAVILVVEATYLLITKARPVGDVLSPAEAVNTTENLQQLGIALFRDYLLPFEVVSILLLVAMVGAIVLTKKEKGVRN
ncbi:MAG: NADH-quinone oxidoreductase subunit J [Anaerolineales bacterium]